MKTLILLAMALALTACAGGQVLKCPACPAEDVWVMTQGGILHFAQGELDLDQPYCMTRPEMEELKRLIELEQQKQKGGAL
jgi:hypothetical protein